MWCCIISLMKAALKSIIALALFVSTSWVFTPHALATAYSPPSGNDADSGVDGVCRLIEILTAINNGAGYNECSAPSGSDTISLPSGTIALTADLPTVVLAAGDSLTVDGAGMSTSVIDGADAYAGFYFQITSGFTPVPNVTVSDFTITNINANNTQGTVRFESVNADVSNIEISSSYFDDRYALNINSVNTSGNTITYNHSIQDVYIHNNTGGATGAIFVVDSDTAAADNHTINLAINRVTITNNASTSMFAGVAIGGDNTLGASQTSFTIQNSTINSMSSGVGLTAVYVVAGQNASSVQDTDISGGITNVTLTNNDGVYASGILVVANESGQVGASANASVDIRNNIIANNTVSGPVTNCMAIADGGTETATITSLGNNLSDDATCGTAQPSDLYSQSTSSITSTLGPLQDNGGSTPTMALLTGSPAIDAGATVGAITTDQRGTARPQGSAYDIGAYELVSSVQPGGNNQSQSQGGLTLPRVGVVFSLPFLASPLVMMGYIFADRRRKNKARFSIISQRIISGNRIVIPLADFVKRQRRRVDGLRHK